MKRIVALIVGVALMAPSVAFASGGSTCQSYNPQLCSVSSNDAQRNTSTSSSTLPFTGLDVALLAAGGAALLGAGLVVRRLSRDLQ
ncbi:MAG: hypothetical protein ACR2ND_14210 [Solirubrobacteraceae bacterium]